MPVPGGAHDALEIREARGPAQFRLCLVIELLATSKVVLWQLAKVRIGLLVVTMKLFMDMVAKIVTSLRALQA